MYALDFTKKNVAAGGTQMMNAYVPSEANQRKRALWLQPGEASFGKRKERKVGQIRVVLLCRLETLRGRVVLLLL